MKILNLDIRAYGHFTDLELDFSAENAGLHVVYGPNEAGKSSALRALKGWLFGIPEWTRDAFLHPTRDLLIGGTLAEGDQTLFFFRRKKRKGSITSMDGEILDPGVLQPFLGGLDLQLFESLYGLDHAALVQGGRDILARRGEIGETLFSAGAGLSSLHRVLLAMEKERDDLYKPRGSNPPVNAALKRCKELRREIRELSLAADQWQEQAARVEEISRKLSQADSERRSLDRRLRHLERLHRAAPLLARRREIISQQKALGPHRPLPDDFPDQRGRAQQERAAAERQLQQLKAREKRVRGELEQLAPREHILAAAPRIDALHQGLGAHDKACRDRPRLQGMRAVHLAEAEQLLALVAPGLDRHTCEPLREILQRKGKLQHLVSQHSALRKTKKDAQTRQERAGMRLEKARAGLEASQVPVDDSDLEKAVTRAQRLGNIDQRISELADQVADLDRDITLGLQRAGFWSGTVAELSVLALPQTESVQAFRDSLGRLKREEQDLAETRAQLQQKLRDLQARRKELEYAGAIPSQQELERIRDRRDQGWQLVCRNWLDGEDISVELAGFSPHTPLAETVTELILEADTLGDRLRLEADRVHTFARLRADISGLEEELQANEQARAELDRERARYRDEWTALWQPLTITPAGPEEMSSWLEQIRELRQRAGELIRLQARHAQLCATRQETIAPLQRLLDIPGDGAGELEPLLVEAGAFFQSLRDRARQYRDREKEVAAAQEELGRAEQEVKTAADELVDWQQQWQEAARYPGSERVVPPDEAQDLLETVEKIFSELKEAEGLQRRMEGIDRDNRDFEERVQRLVAEVAPDLSGEDSGESVLQLKARLAAADREQALRRQREQEAETLAAEIEAEQLVLAGAEKTLAGLLALADCTSEDQLTAAEQKAAEHRQLAEGLRQVEQDLRQVAANMDLEELARQVAEVDVDSLPGEMKTLEQRIERELDPAIRELAEQKGEAGKVLEQMDGSRAAAEKAEELENTLAVLRRDADHYLRLHLGVDMLQREIEEFRRRNQDPVLAIASDLFSRLTLGSFSGLKTDVDDREEPVLVGVRGGTGKTLGVEAMSTGSRDQLYLALRLAGLAHRAASGQVMPFIVDDILINFDDVRTVATLEVLAGQGSRGQIILFTHHLQVAEQAGRLNGVQVLHLA